MLVWAIHSGMLTVVEETGVSTAEGWVWGGMVWTVRTDQATQMLDAVAIAWSFAFPAVLTCFP
jgi:hypothetical protein